MIGFDAPFCEFGDGFFLFGDSLADDIEAGVLGKFEDKFFGDPQWPGDENTDGWLPFGCYAGATGWSVRGEVFIFGEVDVLGTGDSGDEAGEDDGEYGLEHGGKDRDQRRKGARDQRKKGVREVRSKGGRDKRSKG